MPQIHVDGRPFEAAQHAGTFEELLAVLDPAMAAGARIVTAIRVDGVEEPAFREVPVRGRKVAATAHVEVDTEAVEQLAHAALADAVRLMPALATAATDLSRQLTVSDPHTHATTIRELAEGLTLIVTLVQAAEAWADAGRIPRAAWLGDRVTAVAACVDAIATAQQAGDWVSVADALAYDLAPALDGWRSSLSDALADFGARLTATPDHAHAPAR